MSRLILFFHTFVFSCLIIACIASPVIAVNYPGFFRTYSLWVFGAVAALILVSWYFYKGACPLTVWENDFKRKEGKGTYEGSCIENYVKEWIGLSLPAHFGSLITLGILIVPLATRLLL